MLLFLFILIVVDVASAAVCIPAWVYLTYFFVTLTVILVQTFSDL